jgi:hypothetical protein
MHGRVRMILARGGGQAHKTKGINYGQQGDGFTTEPGGILEVAMLGFDIAGSSTQLCCVDRHMT